MQHFLLLTYAILRCVKIDILCCFVYFSYRLYRTYDIFQFIITDAFIMAARLTEVANNHMGLSLPNGIVVCAVVFAGACRMEGGILSKLRHVKQYISIKQFYYVLAPSLLRCSNLMIQICENINARTNIIDSRLRFTLYCGCILQCTSALFVIAI